MINIPTKVSAQLASGLKKYQPILTKARSADVNESDTVTIVVDILSDLFGYDKYSEITSEFAIKKTFCDLAIKIDGKVSLLIECKAIGLSLKDDYARQATNYAADSGIEWVLLTNGIDWKVYKILFAKPIDRELVYEFDMTNMSGKKQSDLEMLFYLSRESRNGKSKNTLEELHVQKQLVNKFIIGQILCTEPVLDCVRKQLRKMSADLKPSNEELKSIIYDEIIKREVTEGEKATEALKKIQKMERLEKVADKVLKTKTVEEKV